MMMDMSRIYFEHPPAYAAIQTVPNHRKINGFNSITPAKAKRSWGDLLRIPGRSKKNSPNNISNQNSSYPPAFNLSHTTPYSPDTYNYANSNVAVRQYDPYGREYIANYGPSYSTYNNTYSRASINNMIQKSDSKIKKGLENKAISYTDWFGTVASKQSPARTRINSPSSPFYLPEKCSSPAWDGLGSVRSPAVVVPATFPVQIYSNLCLCPEQLYSTKTKSRKKCKKCGCKIATIRNATAMSTTKIRPVIPPNFYQPPAISWQMSPPSVTPSQYALPSSHPEGKSTFSPLEEVDEYESPPPTPETIKSFRSSVSSDSNVTLTKSRIRQPKIIPNPPKVPLPPVPELSTNKAINKRSSIIDETKTAYELMDATNNDQEISDSDDLGNNFINSSLEDEICSMSTFSVCNPPRDNYDRGTGKIRKNTKNALSIDDLSKIKRSNLISPFGAAYKSETVKLRSKSSSNIASNLDLTNNKRNLYNSSIKESSSHYNRSFDSQCENKIKRYSDSPDTRSTNGLPHYYKQSSHLSKLPSHQIHLQGQLSDQQTGSKTCTKPKYRPIPPKRDESKLVSIAGQRILFNKPTSVSNCDNFSEKFNQLKTENTIDAWEDVSDCNDYNIESGKTIDNKVVTSLREPNESSVNQILKPFTKRRNVSKESKSILHCSDFDTTIKEEEEVEEHASIRKNLSPRKNTYVGPAYDESDISTVSDSSPERNNRFESSLSDLLNVKSILKRPNSVDTSSENDSDFYLPTYSEYKQMQKKKKSVQFLQSLSANSLIDGEKGLNVDVSNIFFEEIDESSNLGNGTNDGYKFSSTEPKIEAKKLQTSNLIEKHDGKLSESSNDFYHRLNGEQTIDLKDNNSSINSSSSKITLFHQSDLSVSVPTKAISSSRLVTIPSRPTVPPPPPPPQIVIKSEPYVIDATSKQNILCSLSSISCNNTDKLQDAEETLSCSSRCSTPPPLPLSSPPLLNEEEPPPMQIYNNLKEKDMSRRLDSETPIFKKICSFEDPSSVPFSSRIPILANAIQSVNIQKIKRTGISSLPSASKTKPKPKQSKIPRVDKISKGATGQKSQPIIASVDNETDDRFTDHIYEELRSITSSPSSNERSLSPEKSIFDGASKYEILEFLRNARKRVKMDDEDDDLLSETIRNEMEVLALEDDECRVQIEPQDDMILSSIYRDGRSSNRSSNSDSSENSGLLRSDKERLLTGEIERTDSGVGSETSKPNVTVRQQAKSNRSDSNDSGNNIRERNLPPCDDCDFPVEAKVSNGGVMYAPLVCHRCSRRRQERKEILMEIIETEVKYGRDLKVMIDQFYKPMQVAGLLTQDQLRRIFINIEELVDHNRQFALQIKDAYEIALDQGDEDFLTVNVAKLFLQSSSMLHSFQSYCVRQSEASFYLQNLERDRELLRIFLRVSQMENTLLRRMNLHSFLMVPVQRITKYPLLLSRLYKTTPPSHSSREDCRKAREKIELYLQHINNETKGSSSTKLWRRISMSVGGGNGPPRRTSHPPDYDTSLKLRAVALEVLEWANDEATVVREGRLLCLPPDSGNWTRRGRGIKMASVQVALITLGRPRATLEEKIPEDGLITPKNLGIKEAAILAFKDHRLSKSALIRDPWLLSKVVLSWDSEGETESFEVTDMITKETFIFRDRDSVSTEEWFRSAQFHALSVGSWRLRRPALANIMINGARS